MMSKIINKAWFYLLSEKRNRQVEHVVYLLAIITFLIHIGLVVLVNVELLPENYYSSPVPFANLLLTLYTPFSIILLYEVYLMIFYLPHSINIYLGKQYEIVALILIRSIFDKLAYLPAGSENFTYMDLKEILILFGALILILLLIFCFYQLTKDAKRDVTLEGYSSTQYYHYVVIKRGISILLLVFFLILLIYSMRVLLDYPVIRFEDILGIFKKMNRLFFSSFFNVLIITEVLLLLCMYRVNHEFDKVIRNSGFIISTILLKLSFRTEGLVFICMVLLAISFGVVISGIYKLYRQKLNN